MLSSSVTFDAVGVLGPRGAVRGDLHAVAAWLGANYPELAAFTQHGDRPSVTVLGPSLAEIVMLLDVAHVHYAFSYDVVVHRVVDGQHLAD